MTIEQYKFLSIFAENCGNVTLTKDEFAELIPVTKCKNCKWYYYNGNEKQCCTKHTGLALTTPDCFCSYGIKKQ